VIPRQVLSTELPAHVGERVTLAGWMHAKRDLGAVPFLVLRDRAGLAQAVSSKALDLQPETVVEPEGDAVAAAQASGGVELRELSFRVLSEPAAPPPSSCAGRC
jgi:nondiscriminating aspartyl-tRNA synthetase